MGSDDRPAIYEIDEATILTEYRKACEAGDRTLCLLLRGQWNEWEGDDNLHETAFGEPGSTGRSSQCRPVFVLLQTARCLAPALALA
ncbi:MAG: hypothetical protein JWN70_3622 [Planctomycetaceae bacterium]|nr:hypothetical protein [Planctomycetaceae bacterium]